MDHCLQQKVTPSPLPLSTLEGGRVWFHLKLNINSIQDLLLSLRLGDEYIQDGIIFTSQDNQR